MKVIIKTGTIKLKGEDQKNIFTITDGNKEQWDNLLSGGKYTKWFSQLCKNTKNTIQCDRTYC